MFRALRDNKGQGIALQYTLLFALVAAVAFSMSTFFQRAIQGRFFDARHYMHSLANEVYTNGSYNLAGDARISYEPYYRKETSARAIDATIIDKLMDSGAGTAGVSKKEYDQTTTTSLIRNEGLVNEVY